jgi:hypothetical protein
MSRFGLRFWRRGNPSPARSEEDLPSLSQRNAAAVADLYEAISGLLDARNNREVQILGNVRRAYGQTLPEDVPEEIARLLKRLKQEERVDGKK